MHLRLELQWKGCSIGRKFSFQITERTQKTGTTQMSRQTKLASWQQLKASPKPDTTIPVQAVIVKDEPIVDNSVDAKVAEPILNEPKKPFKKIKVEDGN